MSKTSASAKLVTVQQQECVIPDLSVKELLSVIPAHCYKRSAFKSSLYIFHDLFLIGAFYKTAEYLDSLINPETIALPDPWLYSIARFVLWTVYGFATGLAATGLWVIAHECGHQGFSESKFINHTVGWILHSAVGVPYHSWRITHAKHHASSGHMFQDQVFVPKTRSELGLPARKEDKEDLLGGSVTQDVYNELWEALGDSPISASLNSMGYLLMGWPLYISTNASGQARYPPGTNHFTPSSAMFAPHQYGAVIISDIGILLWAAAIAASIYHFGFFPFMRTYLVPYLWVNHWLVMITFLQHTDPALPHYRPAEFTFTRGALATLDRNLLGDLGSVMGWIGGWMTHGISETHVVHHLSSKIPHYNAWEAGDALRAKLSQSGIKLEGRPGGWAEVYRVFRECKFVEDEGDIVFYKNAHGLAQARPSFVSTPNEAASDSGIEVDKDA